MILSAETGCCHIDLKYYATKVRNGIIPQDLPVYVLGEENGFDKWQLISRHATFMTCFFKQQCL